MRIVEFCVGRARTDSSNGVELTVYRLSEALSKDHDVMTLCLSAKPPVPIPGCIVVNHAPEGQMFPIPKSLIATLRAWRPEVVHIHSVYTRANTHLASILRREGIPYIVTPHGGYGEANERHRRVAKAIYRALFELRMLDGATFIHSVGDRADIARLGTSSEIVETTKGLDRPDDLESTAHPRKDRCDEVSEFRFGFVGRLDPLHKGLDILIEAMASPELADARLMLVGPTHENGLGTLEGLAERLGVSDRVEFTGPKVGREKDKAVESFDVFVHTSRWEGGIPYAVLEAASLAKPLLLTAPADPQGQLRDAGASLQVDASVGSVRSGMIELKHSTEEDLRKMGIAGRNFVTSRFGWGLMGEELANALTAKGHGAN